jgi:RNA polymerase sigma factor (sigma-70 family)
MPGKAGRRESSLYRPAGNAQFGLPGTLSAMELERRELLDALAKRAATGEARAMNDLLTEIRGDVLRHCSRILPHPMDSEEACQDTLLAVSKRIGSFEGRSSFSTWLYQVTSNASLDTYRRLKRESARRMEGSFSQISSPDRTSVIAGTRIDLLDAFEQVDDRVSEPIMLRDVLGLEYSEIATLLDVPVGTVKSRIHDGRQALQRLMRDGS